MNLTREQQELKNRFLVEFIDIARERKLSKSQCDDIAIRAVNSGKVFLSTETGELNTLAGYSASEYFDLLAEDKSAAHLTNAAPAKPEPESKFGGMTEEEFNKLPALRRLEIANKQAMKATRERR